MTIEEYFSELAQELQPMAAADRDSVLEYYHEYTEDAHITSGDALTVQPGTPKQLAAQLLANQSIKETVTVNETAPTKPHYRQNAHNTWLIVLAVLSLPLSLPLSIAVGAILFAGLIAIAAVAFAVLITLGVLVLAGICVTIAGLYIGFTLIFSNLFVGMAYLGFALIGIGLTLLLAPFTYQTTLFFVHATSNFSRYLYNKVTRNKHLSAEGGSQS